MYAKEIEPKLHQLDQDKLSQLYSDLRREVKLHSDEIFCLVGILANVVFG